MNIQQIKTSELKPYSKNAKKHPKEQIEHVANSITQFGMVQPIVCDADNVIVIGHCRYMACKKLKMQSVPVLYVEDLTEDQVNALRLADNKTNESEWDADLLDFSLKEIACFDMRDFGFNFAAPRLLEQCERVDDILEDSEEYDEFLEKFKAKKTTDDCFTPPEVYEVVKDWAVERYGLQGREIVRPFYPDGDYQAEEYPENCVVIDNPPFSILAEIKKFYNEQGVAFFLFAPSLTIFGSTHEICNYVLIDSNIRYENGANVPTSFTTNLGSDFITISPELNKLVKEANKTEKDALPKNLFPDEVVTAARLKQYAQRGREINFARNDCHFTRALDAQKETGDALFGSGFLISKEKAAELKAAELKAAELKAAELKAATKWELSDREKAIIETLGGGND